LDNGYLTSFASFHRADFSCGQTPCSHPRY
jgi:hypothetical protein